MALNNSKMAPNGIKCSTYDCHSRVPNKSKQSRVQLQCMFQNCDEAMD